MNLHVQDILDVYFINIRLCYPCWSFVYLFALSYYVFAFVVLCCDVCYDLRIKRCSVRLYLLLFVGGVMSYLCLFVHSGVPHILCCVFVFILFVFVLCLVYTLLPDSLDCPFFIDPSVFSNVYCLWIVHSCLTLRFL